MSVELRLIRRPAATRLRARQQQKTQRRSPGGIGAWSQLHGAECLVALCETRIRGIALVVPVLTVLLSRALRECQLAHHQAVVRWRGRCAETRGPERLGTERCIAVPGP